MKRYTIIVYFNKEKTQFSKENVIARGLKSAINKASKKNQRFGIPMGVLFEDITGTYKDCFNI